MTESRISNIAPALAKVVERIENLEEEKAAIAADIKEVYAEAKGQGFEVKVLRKLIAQRKRDREEVEEEQAILDLYMHALGMVPSANATESEDLL